MSRQKRLSRPRNGEPAHNLKLSWFKSVIVALNHWEGDIG